MINFLESIKRVLGDEMPTGVAIGTGGYMDKATPEDMEGRVLEWNDETRALLDYEYNEDFGGGDCHAVYIWTPSRVLFVGYYDGSTYITSVPRHPVACDPHMYGGG